MQTRAVAWQAAGGRVRSVDDIVDSSLAATQKMVVAFLGRGGFRLIIAVKGGKKGARRKFDCAFAVPSQYGGNGVLSEKTHRNYSSWTARLSSDSASGRNCGDVALSMP